MRVDYIIVYNALLCNIILAFILIPILGPLGLALSNGFGLILWKILSAIYFFR